MFHLALLSAMPQEVGETKKHLRNIKEHKFGDLNIFTGFWDNPLNKKPIFISLAWSGWGKVSAARAATRLISNEISDWIVFKKGSVGNYFINQICSFKK